MKNKKRKINIYLVVLLTGLLSLSFIFFRNKQNRNFTDRAEITFDRQSVSSDKNQEFILNISLDSKNAKVGAADLILNYDPVYLQVKKVIPGKFFNFYPVNKIEASQIRLSGVAAFHGGQLILPNGKDSFAEITFQTLRMSGKTTITINKTETIIGSKGINILNTAKIPEVSVTINE